MPSSFLDFEIIDIVAYVWQRPYGQAQGKYWTEEKKKKRSK